MGNIMKTIIILIASLLCIVSIYGQSNLFLSVDFTGIESNTFGMYKIASFQKNQFISFETGLDLNQTFTSNELENLARELWNPDKIEYIFDKNNPKYALEKGVYLFNSIEGKNEPILIFLKDRDVTIHPKIKQDYPILKVIKVDENGNRIRKSAVFSLCDGDICIESKKTIDGMASFTIPKGSYILKEVKAPDGYVLCSDNTSIEWDGIQFKVNDQIQNREATVSVINERNKVSTSVFIPFGLWMLYGIGSIIFLISLSFLYNKIR